MYQEVQPSFELLKQTAEKQGSFQHTIKGRAKVLRSDYLKTVDQILVCTNTNEDKALRAKFREEAKEGGLTSAIYSSEWIMTSVLRQEIADDERIAILS